MQAFTLIWGLPYLNSFSVFLTTSVMMSVQVVSAQSLEALQQNQPLHSLPSNGNATLRAVGLGVGIQNYSCSSEATEAQSVGAIATVFDITEHLLAHDTANWNKLSERYYETYDRLQCQASQNLKRSECENRVNEWHFDVLGRHWFRSINGKSVPFFDLPRYGFLSAQKVGATPSPKSNAIDWLFLTSDDSPRTEGLCEAYRIFTVGGKADPAGCRSGKKVLSEKYVAMYWFYTT